MSILWMVRCSYFDASGKFIGRWFCAADNDRDLFKKAQNAFNRVAPAGAHRCVMDRTAVGYSAVWFRSGAQP